jgi:hypothetical protein
MNPNLAQGIAAERRADMRREAETYRAARPHSPAIAPAPDAHQRAGRGRIRLVAGQRRQAAHEHTAFSAPADRAAEYLAADEMLVLPDGTAEAAESTGLCSAGR